MARGGKRKGAGRPCISDEVWHAIVSECAAARHEVNENRISEEQLKYFSNFKTPGVENLADALAWHLNTAERERDAALEAGLPMPLTVEESLLDARSLLDAPSGPQGRQLRGLHTIRARRIYGSRLEIFEITAQRLSTRFGHPFAISQIERVWKEYKSIELAASTLIRDR